jgi:hypothetical protein
MQDWSLQMIEGARVESSGGEAAQNLRAHYFACACCSRKFRCTPQGHKPETWVNINLVRKLGSICILHVR